MHLSREIRVCFVTIILLLSSLSILTIFTYTVKAEETAGTTTFYFHEELIEDENLLYLLELYNVEKLSDLIDEDYNESELMDLYDFLSAYGSGRLMDQNPPIKTNDSEYPPTIKTIIDMCRKGEFEELLLNVLTSYFAPFQGAYIYNGEEPLELKGDVKFNLYFSSPPWYLWDSDTVNVSFSVLKILEDVEDPEYLEDFIQTKFTESKEVQVKRKLLSPMKDVVEYEISIPVETYLEQGDVILAEMKISAGNKLLLNYTDFDLSSLNETIKLLGESLGNISFLSGISETLLNLSELFGSEEFADLNLTDIIKQMSSSFIYDSANHKSSITLPGSISGDEDNIRTYYLHSGNQMNEDIPVNEKPSEAVISKGFASWGSPGLERSKLIEAATASLYIDHRDMRRLINILRGKIKVVATLSDGDTEIASAETELDRTGILDLLRKPSEPILFNFNDTESHEIPYGENLTLTVSVTDSKLGLFRMASVLYDSVDYPSSLTVEFAETDNIKIVDFIKNPSDEKIALGDSVIYTFNVSSKYREDKTEISFSEDHDNWDITITPEKFSLAANGKQNVTVVVKSKATKYDKNLYGEFLSGKFAVEGKTGKVTYPVNIEISEDAVEYNIGIAGQDQDIKYGKSGEYKFKIKNLNTGFWPDTYTITVESEHDWDLNYSKTPIKLDAGDEAEVKVTVSVPKNTSASSDLLKFTVKGTKETKTVNVTTTVIGPNILEMIYDAFDSASHSLGLDEVFGSYGAHFLAVIIFIIIFFIVILLVYLFTIKHAKVICLERIKEIQPGEEARFNITLQNPYKRKLSYEIYTRCPPSSGWNVSLDINSVSLEKKQSREFTLVVKPTSFVKADDWLEVVVGVKVLDKQKNIEISTVTTIKDAKPDLQINDVTHLPEVFKKGDRVETSFKLENRGKAAATNVSVILYVNGEEKNKVEDINIPGGGYAEIRMPWIADKGKNEFNIVVK